MSGDTIFLCEGDSRAMVISSKGFIKRSPEEPQTDIVTNGPHEGFIEPMIHNVAMLRRKLKTHMLRVEGISSARPSKPPPPSALSKGWPTTKSWPSSSGGWTGSGT